MTDPATPSQSGFPRFLRIATQVCLLLFLVGWAALSAFFRSPLFPSLVDSLIRPGLEARGIRFDQIDVSPLGTIRITNLRIRLPDGTDFEIPELTGSTDPTALIKGEAQITLDISELAQKYLARRRFGTGAKSIKVGLGKASKILYLSVASSLAKLGQLDMVRGDLALSGVELGIEAGETGEAPFPVQFEDGTLSLFQHVLTSDGLRFRLPSLAGLEGSTGDDLVFTFEGNIRSVFTEPEFVDGKVRTDVALEPAWRRALDMLNLEEVTRKIAWFGPLTVRADLEGPVVSPAVRGFLLTEDLYLRMRGEFRQINIRWKGVRGKIHRSLEGDFDLAFESTGLEGEYFRHRDEDLPHLFLRADAMACRATYANRILTLGDVRFSAYGGSAHGSLTWDLTDRNIPLGPGRTGDTAYSYELGMKDFDLGTLIQDVTTIRRPLEGKFRGYLEGRGRTLMLERMNGEGKFQVDGLKLGEPPEGDVVRSVLGPLATAELPGTELGNLAGDWVMVQGDLQVPKFEVAGPDGRLGGSLSYGVLTLELAGALRFAPSPAGLGERPNLARSLGADGVVDVALGGRVVDPEIRYRISRP